MACELAFELMEGDARDFLSYSNAVELVQVRTADVDSVRPFGEVLGRNINREPENPVTTPVPLGSDLEYEVDKLVRV